VSGPVVESLLQVVSAYGGPALFVTSLAENVFLLGFVVPGDVVVIAGGALAAGGHLRLITAFLAVILGTISGAVLSFFVGSHGGTALVERWGGRAGIDRPRIRAVEDYFQAHGAKTVFLGSFVAGIKNLAPVVAGASGMGFVRFLAYNAAGAVCRSAGLMGVGYVFGANADHALRVVASLNVWVVVLIALALAALLLFRWLRRRAP
jgi:membrane protein DedA with SNARE-associated domain